MAYRGIPVAEFNMETTPATKKFRYGDNQAGLMGGGGWDWECHPNRLYSSDFHGGPERRMRAKKRVDVFSLDLYLTFMKEQNAINCRLGGCVSLHRNFHRASVFPIGTIYISLDFIFAFVVFN